MNAKTQNGPTRSRAIRQPGPNPLVYLEPSSASPNAGESSRDALDARNAEALMTDGIHPWSKPGIVKAIMRHLNDTKDVEP